MAVFNFKCKQENLAVVVHVPRMTQNLVIKHLMTGPKGNSEFCFPETLNVSRGEATGNIEVEGKQNSMFPAGPVIKCFVIPPSSKLEKTVKKSFA